MQMRPVTGNPSQLIVEQLVASGVKYVFYNSGSREALFFDALYRHPDIHGILALHEGTVTAMAGGYTQARGDVAVTVVHLGAGLAQCLGQLINVWTGSLPVVVITFAGDTGSFADRIALDVSHNFGPTAISAPFTKANWSVIDPEGLPQAVERAIRVARTPPVGPVHLAVYDRLLGDQEITANILEGGLPEPRAGYPSDEDLTCIAGALRDARRPLFYVGDGVWKSGAEARLTALAELSGAAVANAPYGDFRGVPIKHPQHCGPLDAAVAALDPDLILCVGVRHGGSGRLEDYQSFSAARRVMAIGPDIENFENLPGLELAVLADERRTLDRLLSMVQEEGPERHVQRRDWATTRASELRETRRQRFRAMAPQSSEVRPLVLAEALDRALERRGGGMVMIEQFAAPLDCLEDPSGGCGNNVYVRPAGGSEGYGIGGAAGLKLAAPDKTVVGLVGDGSILYGDSGLWTAVHHGIPVLYVVPDNRSYGIVAGYFGQAEGAMKQDSEYAGVVLDGIDLVQIAGGFGLEGIRVEDESGLDDAIEHGLQVVEDEQRPFLLDVRLPLGLPAGGQAAAQFQLAASAAGAGR